MLRLQWDGFCAGGKRTRRDRRSNMCTMQFSKERWVEGGMDSDHITERQVGARGGGGVEAALRALQQGKVDIGVLQETKLNQGIHTPYVSGYYVWEAEADIRRRGGGGIGGMENESEVAVRGLFPLQLKHGMFLVDNGATKMLCNRFLRYPK